MRDTTTSLRTAELLTAVAICTAGWSAVGCGEDTREAAFAEMTSTCAGPVTMPMAPLAQFRESLGLGDSVGNIVDSGDWWTGAPGRLDLAGKVKFFCGYYPPDPGVAPLPYERVRFPAAGVVGGSPDGVIELHYYLPSQRVSAVSVTTSSAWGAAGITGVAPSSRGSVRQVVDVVARLCPGNSPVSLLAAVDSAYPADRPLIPMETYHSAITNVRVGNVALSSVGFTPESKIGERAHWSITLTCLGSWRDAATALGIGS